MKLILPAAIGTNMLTEKCNKTFANGVVYLLHTEDDFPIETTDTFLPFYTKDAIGNKQNCLRDYEVGSRAERWMIGISCMSGCPVKCKFCATAKLKKWRNLKYIEIVQQVMFILDKNGIHLNNNGEYVVDAMEFKINYTRMGEPFLNLDNVKKAIAIIDRIVKIKNGGKVHHYISTIGLQNSDFGWITGNITLQISLHSLDEQKRNWLIPVSHKMTIEQLGQVRTYSNLKTTLNMTLVDERDFDIDVLRKHFDPNEFFIKLSPINKNDVSEKNNLGNGVIEAQNLI